MFPQRNALFASEESSEAVSRPNVKYGEGTGFEGCVSEIMVVLVVVLQVVMQNCLKQREN